MADDAKPTKKESLPENTWHRLATLNLNATICAKGVLVRDVATGHLQFIPGATLSTDDSGTVLLR